MEPTESEGKVPEVKVPSTPKAPWLHRFGVVFFTILAGVLAFWLLGFVVDDIGALNGPQQEEVEKRYLDPALVAQTQEIEKNIDAIHGQIESQKARQTLLRDSTSSSQQTMNQLLEVQKLNLQNHVTPSTAEREALAQSESLFITNQARYQTLNDEISKRSEEEEELVARKTTLEARLKVQRDKAAQVLRVLQRRHELRVAAMQLTFLLPILLLAVYFILKARRSLYAPLSYAFGIAVLIKVILVVHEHFPTRYFKYILLAAALAVVVRTVIYLLRASASPKIAALLKQYREAYERFLCPVCEYPIRRGPMRYAFWNRRSIRRMQPKTRAPLAPEEPYACPSCGARLFEACPVCSNVRHSLLPFCDHCGNEKAM